MEQGKTIAELEKSLVIEKRTNELNERELYLQKKIIEVKDMEIAGLNRNFDQMKEVADRAIKLAETVKPKSNWQLWGLVGVIAFVAGLAVGL
jgi:fructose-bisphosphate aldolase class 1